ncbi:DUF554 family protein [Paenibacillus sp. W4I10]|uniref:DUF554 family protein n=1 Tax=Paenibacillus sp. W4I10 TaxID=3042298 RepID=UPI0027D79A12|nr:DUF554 family protein [Paenibacillus sp. W4I10]
MLFCWQGLLFLLAHVLSGLITPVLLTEISIVGGILIFCSGLSILGICKFNSLNLIPSLVIPVLFFIIKSVAGI